MGGGCGANSDFVVQYSDLSNLHTESLFNFSGRSSEQRRLATSANQPCWSLMQSRSGEWEQMVVHRRKPAPKEARLMHAVYALCRHELHIM